MSLGRNIHIASPMGQNGQGPFVTLSSEARRVYLSILTTLLLEVGEWPHDPTRGMPWDRILEGPGDSDQADLLRSLARRQIEAVEGDRVILGDLGVALNTSDNGVAVRLVIPAYLTRTDERVRFPVTLEFVR